MKYTSCNWISHGISFDRDKIRVCCVNCNDDGGEIPIQLNYNYSNIVKDSVCDYYVI